jgi:hypothetical protein
MIGTPYQRSSEIVLYIQETERVFRTRDFQETSAGFGVKIADLNDDGNNDVVFGTASEGIEVWLGEGRVTLTDFPCTEASEGLPYYDGYWSQLELGDVNDDGKLDIISACNTYTTVNVFINDLPNGWIEVFTESNALEVGGEPYGANFGDWDGDGLLDVAGCSWNHGANAWLVSLEGYGFPIANAGDDEIMNLGETLRLDGSDSLDRDGTIVEWSWECITHPTVVLAEVNTSRPRFTPVEDGIYDFQLMVRDDEEQWSNPDSVTITVLDPGVNYPPVAVPYHETGFGLVGETIYLDGSDSYDQDGMVETYSWSSKEPSDLLIYDADKEDPFFLASVEGDHIISLVVTDDGGGQSPPAYITIHIEADAVEVKLGPFKYDNGDPIKGAEVWLKSDGYLFNAETDSDGYADFYNGVPPGDYVCFVTKDNYIIIDEFSLSISYTGTVSIDQGTYPTAVSDETMIWLVIVIVVVIVLLMVGIGLFTAWKMKKNQPETVEAVVKESGGCPQCGGQLTYMQDFKRYFCSRCNEYF